MEELIIFGIISSIANALLGLWNGANTNQTNREITNATNRANERINAAQLAHADQSAAMADTRTRNLFGDLYSPQAKIAQYKEAGLNPALMYGAQGNMGTSTSGAQAATPNAIAMQSAKMERLLGMDNSSVISNALNQAAQTKLLEAQAQNQLADLPLKEQMILEIKERTKTYQSQIDLNYQKIEESIANIGNINAQKELNEQLTKLKAAETAIANTDLLTRGEINQATLNKLNAETEKFAAQAKEAIAAANKYNWEAKEIKDTLQLKIKQMECNILQTIANTEQLNAVTRKLDSETWLNKLEAEPEQALQDWLNKASDTPGFGTGMYREITKGIGKVMDTCSDIIRVIFK